MKNRVISDNLYFIFKMGKNLHSSMSCDIECDDVCHISRAFLYLNSKYVHKKSNISDTVVFPLVSTFFC